MTCAGGGGRGTSFFRWEKHIQSGKFQKSEVFISTTLRSDLIIDLVNSLSMHVRNLCHLTSKVDFGGRGWEEPQTPTWLWCINVAFFLIRFFFNVNYMQSLLCVLKTLLYCPRVAFAISLRIPQWIARVVLMCIWGIGLHMDKEIRQN